MGKKLVFVPECPSTNALALEISQQSPPPEGTIVITDHQTAGRGQRGNSWESEPFKNLTFSLILRPEFLPIRKQFLLNVAVCLAAKDYLNEKISDVIHIKWPNDILVHEKKISGILIENQVQGSVFRVAISGIGLNINQSIFTTPLATSLSLISGKTYELNQELHHVLGFIERRYLELRANKIEAMMQEYLGALYRRHEWHTFITDDGEMAGRIEDVEESGRLRVETKDGLKSFGTKEIRFTDRP